MRTLALIVVVFAVLVGNQTVVLASLQAGDTISFDRTAGTFSGSGGEFKATSGSLVFQTFCIEDSQTIGMGTNYEVHTIIDRAITGPSGSPDSYGVLSADVVDGETAWLFLQFWNEVQLGGTSPLNYLSGTRSVNAGLLQDAIWQLEGGAATNNAYYNLALAASETDKDAALTVVRAINPISDGTIDGNVSAGNTNAGVHVQSMLYVIPEATTVVIWSVLSLIGLVGRRQRS